MRECLSWAENEVNDLKNHKLAGSDISSKDFVLVSKFAALMGVYLGSDVTKGGTAIKLNICHSYIKGKHNYFCLSNN